MELDVVYSPQPVAYTEALKQQKEFHSARVAHKIPDTLWLLEHPPVITTGIRKKQEGNLRIDPQSVGVEVIHTERGGEVTYHGPGQLVGYIFAGIEGHGFRVKQFVSNLESAFISYLSSLGIHARHDLQHTGVWIDMDKITAIGIALRERTTFHGFAFNVCTNLSHFDWIVPCGISDPNRGVTSLKEQLHSSTPTMDEVVQDLSQYIRSSLGYQGGSFSLMNERVSFFSGS
ncbi:MAG: lipoyl(octanoyl) transferase LipB [Spirochaetales bacterium]|nr:lipoyl(octanoyl) transferase LipB [Spirochaetales bacterium]